MEYERVSESHEEDIHSSFSSPFPFLLKLPILQVPSLSLKDNLTMFPFSNGIFLKFFFFRISSAFHSQVIYQA